MTEVREFVTMVGVLIAAASLAFTALNTWTTGKTNRARFWLDLRSAFSKHDVVHFNLRPGGIWTDGKGPQTAHEWALVDAYMGLFEHCEIMLKEALIDLPTFKAIYGYRLHNILANGTVRQVKLVNEAEYWTLFLALIERMRRVETDDCNDRTVLLPSVRCRETLTNSSSYGTVTNTSSYD